MIGTALDGVWWFSQLLVRYLNHISRYRIPLRRQIVVLSPGGVPWDLDTSRAFSAPVRRFRRSETVQVRFGPSQCPSGMAGPSDGFRRRRSQLELVDRPAGSTRSNRCPTPGPSRHVLGPVGSGCFRPYRRPSDVRWGRQRVVRNRKTGFDIAVYGLSPGPYLISTSKEPPDCGQPDRYQPEKGPSVTFGV